MTGYNPDSWLDIIGLLIIGVAFVAAAAAPGWFRNRDAHAKLGEVHDQVKNNHATNLRDDMDRMIQRLDDIGDRVDGIAIRVDGIASRVDQLR